MPQFLDRAQGALMLDEAPKNVRATISDLVAKGPLTAVYNGVERVWNTNARRVDHIAGTHLSSGGPVR